MGLQSKLGIQDLSFSFFGYIFDLIIFPEDQSTRWTGFHIPWFFPALTEKMDTLGTLLGNAQFFIPINTPVRTCLYSLFLSFALLWVDDDNAILALVDRFPASGLLARRVLTLHTWFGNVGDFYLGVLTSLYQVNMHPEMSRVTQASRMSYKEPVPQVSSKPQACSASQYQPSQLSGFRIMGVLPPQRLRTRRIRPCEFR